MIARDTADPYLGREDQLERLVDLLAEAAAGRGSWAIIRGPAGAGSTATAREVAARAAGQGFEVLWGGCSEGVAGRPFDGLAQGFDDYARRAGPAALYTELGDAAPVLARVAPAVRLALPAVPPPAPLGAHAETLRINDAVLGWLSRAAAERPLLVVIDDLQWADDDLSRLLEHLAAHLSGMAVLLLATWADYAGTDAATADTASTAGTAASTHDLPAAAQVFELAGLDEGATGALLTRITDRPISAGSLRLIQQLTGGHPLGATEFYRHLREEGAVGRPGGDTLPAAEALPGTVEEIVAWRAARLSLEERTALGALACFPAATTAGPLATVSGLSRTRAAEALERAVASGFVRSPEASGMYAVSHPLIARALRDGLSMGVRAEAVGRVAESIEAELGAEARQQAPLLAELYGRSVREMASADAASAAAALAGASSAAVASAGAASAGAASAGAASPARPLGDAFASRAAAGMRHALVAAEQARAAAAYRRAAGAVALAHALAEAARQPARHELGLRLGLAQAEADDPEQAVDTVEQGLAHNADLAATELAIATIRALLDHGRAAQAERLRLALHLSLRSPVAALAARLELLAGRWQAVENSAVRALVWIIDEDQAERVLLRDGDEQDRGELFAAARPRTHEQTVALLNLARDWRRPATLLRALHGAAVDLATRLGLYREALSWAGQYAAAAERYGSPLDEVRAGLLLAQCQAVLGDFGAADESLAAAERTAERLPAAERPAVERLAAELALAHYRDGDWAELAARCTGLTAEPSTHGMLLGAESALAHARAGDTGRAGELTAGVLELVEQWPPLTYLRDGAMLVALAEAWESGRAQHALRGRSLATLAAAAGVGGNHAATPELTRARMHALAGQVDEARALFDAQRAALDESGMRPLRAIVDCDEAVALAAAGEAGYSPAAALLETAAASFDELGMSGWHGRARRLLDGGLAAAAQPGGRLHFTYPAGLSRREADLVRLISAGASLEEAAAELELDLELGRRHVGSALEKLGGGQIDELPRLARRHGLGGGI